jgi:SAM-dependent methyltransferase
MLASISCGRPASANRYLKDFHTCASCSLTIIGFGLRAVLAAENRSGDPGMKTQDTDKYWQFIGDDNPYWGVITHDEFDKTRLTREAVEDFYASGETHADLLFRTIRRYIDDRFAAQSALDFGCGVGRIVIPLASRCRTVTGVDVSDGMLQKARERCDELRLSNVHLIKADDQLSLVTERFDLIHSFIVLQHINPERGYDITERLLKLLNNGGVGVLHFVYSKASQSRHPKLRALAENLGLYQSLCRIRAMLQLSGDASKDRNPDGLEMQMNPYNLNPIFDKLQKVGVRRLHVEFTDHGGFLGVVLFFKKDDKEEYSM